MSAERERLEKKIRYLKELLKFNETNDLLRVRRKIDSEQATNKIAKILLALSAMNGYNEIQKLRFRHETDENEDEKHVRSDSDKEEDVEKRPRSTNEERYKVKKWIENLKRKRSSNVCPCVLHRRYEDEEFPLEKTLAKGKVIVRILMKLKN